MKYITPLLLLLVIPAVMADGAAEYKYREAVMESIGGHMKSIGAILRGQVHSENLPTHAESMVDLAKIVPHVFPEGSAVSKSEALPAVWEKPEEFKQATQQFIEAANAFAAAVESGEGVGDGVRGLSDACKGCHDNFREEH